MRNRRPRRRILLSTLAAGALAVAGVATLTAPTALGASGPVAPPASPADPAGRQAAFAGAALLASYEKQYNHGVLPPAPDLIGWTVAVARYAQSTETKIAQVFADDVFATIRTGEASTTQDGQNLSLPSVPYAFDDPAAARRLGLVSVVPPAD